jgi:hypothetical protein
VKAPPAHGPDGPARQAVACGKGGPARETWQKFAIATPETLYTKNAVNQHSFVLVTHMACFDTRFGRYGFLKTK